AIHVPVEELVPYIDWSPFFHTWELRGVYPAILEHPRHGEEARKLHADAMELLERIIRERRLEPRGVYGFFPAHRRGDDVVIFEDESREQPLATFHFLRQQMVKDDGKPNWCLADFIAPGSDMEGSQGSDDGAPAAAHRRKAHLIRDYLRAFAVTSGHGLMELVLEFKAAHDDYNAIMAEALADRLAEAFAEYLHQRVREEWGYGRGENLSNEDLIKERYRGIRPAAGYPACPDHTEKRTLWRV